MTSSTHLTLGSGMSKVALDPAVETLGLVGLSSLKKINRRIKKIILNQHRLIQVCHG